jgi:hypothetical protein
VCYSAQNKSAGPWTALDPRSARRLPKAQLDDHTDPFHQPSPRPILGEAHPLPVVLRDRTHCKMMPSRDRARGLLSTRTINYMATRVLRNRVVKTVKPANGGNGTEKPKPSKPKTRVTFEASDSTHTCYCNLVEVGALQHEFTILAGRVPTKPTRAIMSTISEGGEIVLEPEVQLLVAPTMIPGVIKALQAQLEKYEKRYGPVRTKKGEADA